MSHRAIIGQQQEQTLERMSEQGQVLLLQDTTSFDFSHHPAAGMGPMENEYCRGFFAHSTLGVSMDGVPLGLLGQPVWARLDSETGKAAQRHERAFEDKESYKGVQGLPKRTATATMPERISVSDQESHIYEYLDALLTRQMQFSVRATAGRAFTEDGQVY